jgi:hypothetical protein
MCEFGKTGENQCLTCPDSRKPGGLAKDARLFKFVPLPGRSIWCLNKPFTSPRLVDVAFFIYHNDRIRRAGYE